jgi:hypothetical protein
MPGITTSLSLILIIYIDFPLSFMFVCQISPPPPASLPVGVRTYEGVLAKDDKDEVGGPSPICVYICIIYREK